MRPQHIDAVMQEVVIDKQDLKDPTAELKEVDHRPRLLEGSANLLVHEDRQQGPFG